MVGKIENQWGGFVFHVLIMNLIMKNSRADETPQARLKQIGMMSILHQMSIEERPLTLTNIMQVTKLTRGGVSETIDMLIKRDLLTEKMVKNSMGRGKAREFEISYDLIAKISALELDN